MSELRNLWPQSGSDIGVIVHAGHGAEAALADYLATKAKRIVVLEPDEQTAANLRSGTGRDSRVEVINAVLGANPGKASLIRFNFSELDSVVEPTGLKKLFPGLRETGRDTVPTVTPADLLQRLDAVEGALNWLIMDTPGQDLALLGALSEDGHLKAFSTLLIRTSQEILYKGGADLSALETWLQAKGFTKNRALGGEDVSRPWLRLSYDEAKDLQAQAAKNAKVMQEKIMALETKCATIQAERDTLSTTLSKNEKRETKTNTQIAELKAALAKAQAELEANLSESKNARRQAGTAKAQVTRMRNQSEAAKAEIADLIAQNESLAAELESLRAQNVQMKQASDLAADHKEKLAQALAENANLKAQVEASNSSAANATAAQQKASADLAEQTQRNTDLDAKFGQLSAKLAEAEEQIASITVEREEARAEVVKVREALENRRARVANVEKEVADLQTAIEETQQKTTVLTQERDDAAQEVIKVRAALETTRAKVTSLEADTNKLTRAAEVKQAALQAECDALNEKLMRSRHELLKLEGQIEVIRGLFLQQVPSV